MPWCIAIPVIDGIIKCATLYRFTYYHHPPLPAYYVNIKWNNRKRRARSRSLNNGQHQNLKRRRKAKRIWSPPLSIRSNPCFNRHQKQIIVTRIIPFYIMSPFGKKIRSSFWKNQKDCPINCKRSYDASLTPPWPIYVGPRERLIPIYSNHHNILAIIIWVSSLYHQRQWTLQHPRVSAKRILNRIINSTYHKNWSNALWDIRRPNIRYGHCCNPWNFHAIRHYNVNRGRHWLPGAPATTTIRSMMPMRRTDCGRNWTLSNASFFHLGTSTNADGFHSHPSIHWTIPICRPRHQHTRRPRPSPYRPKFIFVHQTATAITTTQPSK